MAGEEREKQHLTSGLRRGKKTAVGPWSVPSSLTLARLFGPTCPSAYLLPLSLSFSLSLSPRPSRSSSIPRTHPVSLPLPRRGCPFSGGPLPTSWLPPPNRPQRINHLAPSLVRSVSREAGEVGRKRDISSLLARSLYPSLPSASPSRHPVAHHRSHARLDSSNSPESRGITRITAR